MGALGPQRKEQQSSQRRWCLAEPGGSPPGGWTEAGKGSRQPQTAFIRTRHKVCWKRIYLFPNATMLKDRHKHSSW